MQLLYWWELMSVLVSYSSCFNRQKKTTWDVRCAFFEVAIFNKLILKPAFHDIDEKMPQLERFLVLMYDIKVPLVQLKHAFTSKGSLKTANVTGHLCNTVCYANIEDAHLICEQYA